ncbi:hypothetical protein QAD02_006390 [Eretmocerus hayati]|uniref:Uncharacterized protein n=1 Tax=Eretmocerus hayati TaxID=131215 RepID=A0ACC2N1U7_9HYME|nr:hypothetical protein QAD02_006390 [Eretmocerus hayati]
MLPLLIILSALAIQANSESLNRNSTPNTLESKPAIIYHRYLVSIETGDDDYCSGTIIKPYLLYTTAYCAKKVKENSYSIRSASDQRGNGGILHRVRQAISHPHYDPETLKNNVALISVNDEFDEQSESIFPNTMPSLSDYGTHGIVKGWGLTNSNSWTNEISQSDFVIIKKNKEDEDGLYYARNRDKSDDLTCYSGGAPYVMRVDGVNYLVGFSTGNVYDCQKTGYESYADVARYKAWTLEVFKKNMSNSEGEFLIE